jgi:hypothetical protein
MLLLLLLLLLLLPLAASIHQAPTIAHSSSAYHALTQLISASKHCTCFAPPTLTGKHDLFASSECGAMV